jgi:hypothetical protein
MLSPFSGMSTGTFPVLDLPTNNRKQITQALPSRINLTQKV